MNWLCSLPAFSTGRFSFCRTRTFRASKAAVSTKLPVNRVAAIPKISKDVAPSDKGCPVCRQGLQYFGYRDVLLLRQFLNPEGYLIGRRYTHVCPKLQRRLAKCIRRSRRMGLLPNFQENKTCTDKAVPIILMEEKQLITQPS